MGGKVVMNL